MTDGMDMDAGLFDMRPNASTLLSVRYGVPPFSVLSRRDGAWIERDRKWKALGIESELGRDDALTYGMRMDYARPDGPKEDNAIPPQTSVFSPALAEWYYRNHSRPGDRVLDPFAGGSVRGVVAGAMGRHYTGVELRAAQVAANKTQADIAGDITPQWLAGDSADLSDLVGPAYEADLIFSCPPYAYLEKYSDDPRDLSNMPYAEFRDVYRDIIRQAVDHLRPDRFIGWVVGEVRNKRDGSLLGLVPDTIAAFQDAGASYWNDHVMLTPIGTAQVRTPKQWDTSRKAGRVHEYLLTFVKGDARRAAAWLDGRADVPADDLDDAGQAVSA